MGRVSPGVKGSRLRSFRLRDAGLGNTGIHFGRTAAGQEADLVLDRGSTRIAIEFKANSATNLHAARKLDATLDDIGADYGWLVGLGGESTALTPRVRSTSLDIHPDWLP